MCWPLDVFENYVNEIPLIAGEMNGLRDGRKVAMAWNVDDVKRREALRRIGHPGYWKLNG
jgi:hypothetical protein